MINLLPPELKESYRYAQRNGRLLRWLVALIFGFAGFVGISTAGIVYMRQTSEGYSRQIQSSEQILQTQKLSPTQAQVEDINKNLKLAAQVLSQEILFSKLLQQLTAITPSNAVLTDLKISQTQGALDITALTTDYNAAMQLQVNLADPHNKIFTHADVVSIICASTSSSDPTTAHYPCTVVIRALFTIPNPYLFINDKGNG